MSKLTAKPDREDADNDLMATAKRALTGAGGEARKKLSLGEYRRLLQACDRPTRAQIDAFVGFVSSAHSWYKHLPLHPPGVPFVFYPDPWAGCDAVLAPNGEIRVRERVGEQGFHYSWMPTAEYRRQFGCLNYHTCAGSSFFLSSAVFVNPLPPAPRLFTAQGPAALPDQVLEAGRTSCTAVIHGRTRMIRYWTWRRAGPWREVEWTDEGGGEALKEAILQYIERTKRERSHGLASSRGPGARDTEAHRPDHAQLRDILAPEQKRQTDAMSRTIRAVCNVVWG